MSDVKDKTTLVGRTRGGRITIPVAFRRRLGIDDDRPLEITLDDGELRLKPVRAAEPTGGSSWFRDLYDFFAPARAEAIEKGYTDEEINAWIDEAVAEVRAKHG